MSLQQFIDQYREGEAQDYIPENRRQLLEPGGLDNLVEFYSQQVQEAAQDPVALEEAAEEAGWFDWGKEGLAGTLRMVSSSAQTMERLTGVGGDFGEWAKQKSRDLAETTNRNYLDDLQYGLGTSVPTYGLMLAGSVAGPIGAALGGLLGLGLAVTSHMDQAYENLKDVEDLTEQEKFNRELQVGLFLGATEVLPPFKVLKFLGKKKGRVVREVGETAIFEGAQESLSELVHKWAAGQEIDPEAVKEVMYSGLIGANVGALFGLTPAAGRAYRRFRAGNEEEAGPPPDEIDLSKPPEGLGEPPPQNTPQEPPGSPQTPPEQEQVGEQPVEPQTPKAAVPRQEAKQVEEQVKADTGLEVPPEAEAAVQEADAVVEQAEQELQQKQQSPPGQTQEQPAPQAQEPPPAVPSQPLPEERAPGANLAQSVIDEISGLSNMERLPEGGVVPKEGLSQEAADVVNQNARQILVNHEEDVAAIHGENLHGVPDEQARERITFKDDDSVIIRYPDGGYVEGISDADLVGGKYEGVGGVDLFTPKAEADARLESPAGQQGKEVLEADEKAADDAREDVEPESKPALTDETEPDGAQEAKDEIDEGRPEETPQKLLETGAVGEDAGGQVGIKDTGDSDAQYAEQDREGSPEAAEGRGETGAATDERGARPAAEDSGTAEGDESRGRQAETQHQDGVPERAVADSVDRAGDEGDVSEYIPGLVDAVNAISNVPSSPVARLNANFDAVRVLKKHELAGTKPNQEENMILLGYSGAGGLGNALNKKIKEVKEVFTEPEIERLKISNLDAHYTPAEAISMMWNVMSYAGFRGGKVFEPGSGIGRFAALIPEGIRSSTRMRMVELDSVSGRIAKMLFEGGGRKHHVDSGMNLRRVKDIDNTFDLVIGNVPFGRTKIPYKRKSESIHNYFILRAIDALKPGGMTALITSRQTMDASEHTRHRQLIYEKADLIAAVKMPTLLHYDTGARVTTDILVFRKRKPGEKPLSAEWLDTVPLLPSRWTKTQKFGKSKKREIPHFFVNKFFEHRQNEVAKVVLGEWVHEDRGARKEASLMTRRDFYDVVATAEESLKAQIEASEYKYNPEAIEEDKKSFEPVQEQQVWRERRMVADREKNTITTQKADGTKKTKKVNPEVADRVFRMEEILDGVIQANEMNADLNVSADVVEKAKLEVVQKHREFLEKYGPIMDHVHEIKGDPQWPQITVLEKSKDEC